MITKVWTLPILLSVIHPITAFLLPTSTSTAPSAIRSPHSHHFQSLGDNDDETWTEDGLTPADKARRDLIIDAVGLGLIGVSAYSSYTLFNTNVYTPDGFKRIPTTQFIAALGDPKSASGTGTDKWGLWKEDPGPRGVYLKDYDKLLASNDNRAPLGWKFDAKDWWLEEHGIIMEEPSFALRPGRYLVTGGRSVTTGLTIDDAGGWTLDKGTLYDVTHLPCRSARYTPVSENENGGPLTANRGDFPVKPGAVMPDVEGCRRQDYAVLFLVGKAV